MKKIKLNYFTRLGREGRDWVGSTRLGKEGGGKDETGGGKEEIGERRTRLRREGQDWGRKDETGEGRRKGCLSPNFENFKEPKNRFQGINSASPL